MLLLMLPCLSIANHAARIASATLANWPRGIFLFLFLSTRDSFGDINRLLGTGAVGGAFGETNTNTNSQNHNHKHTHTHTHTPSQLPVGKSAGKWSQQERDSNFFCMPEDCLLLLLMLLNGKLAA